MDYAAVMFDLDGTLLDTLDDLADSMNGALAGLGLPPHPTDAYRIFVGDGVEPLGRRVLPENGLDLLDPLLDSFRQRYSENWANKTRLYDGVSNLLEELQTRGIPLTILSNKPDEMTQIVVRTFFPDTPFAAVRGATQGVPRKPDPEGALVIAEIIDIEPRRFLYLGDTNTDMETACSAGMIPTGALWGFRDEEELRAAGARYLLKKPRDLLSL